MRLMVGICASAKCGKCSRACSSASCRPRGAGRRSFCTNARQWRSNSSVLPSAISAPRCREAHSSALPSRPARRSRRIVCTPTYGARLTPAAAADPNDPPKLPAPAPPSPSSAAPAAPPFLSSIVAKSASATSTWPWRYRWSASGAASAAPTSLPPRPPSPPASPRAANGPRSVSSALSTLFATFPMAPCSALCSDFTLPSTSVSAAAACSAATAARASAAVTPPSDTRA
mmetsp:Transcript_12936/g.45272  ORF Transcript_12936/g.45272 Transcript_12936/m.45272 type:complete len:230 (-) Transcript_12936:284-973(-)